MSGGRPCRVTSWSRSSAACATSGLDARGIVAIFQNVAGLAVERLADQRERVEAHALDLARLQQRDVLFGDSNALGELLRAHLPPRQHDVEIDGDPHRYRTSDEGRI